MRLQQVFSSLILVAVAIALAVTPARAQNSVQAPPAMTGPLAPCNLTGSSQETGFDANGAGGSSTIDCNTNISISGVLAIGGSMLTGAGVATVNALLGVPQCSQTEALTKIRSNPDAYACVDIGTLLPRCPAGTALVSNGPPNFGWTCRTAAMNAACGPSSGHNLAAMPNGGWCDAGTLASLRTDDAGNVKTVSWVCLGTNGGANATCTTAVESSTSGN